MSHLKPNEKIIVKDMLNEKVLLDTRDGSYYSLNPIAAYIWDSLSKSVDVDSICTQLSIRYNLPINYAFRDVNEFVMDLKKHSLLD